MNPFWRKTLGTNPGWERKVSKAHEKERSQDPEIGVSAQQYPKAGQGQKDREQGGHAYKGGALLRGCDYFWSYRGRMSFEISHLLVWYLSVRVPTEKR